MLDTFTLPVVATFVNVVLPVTPSVPDAVIFDADVFPPTVKVPEFVVFASVVAPVTSSVVPIVAEPVVETLVYVVFPDAFNLP